MYFVLLHCCNIVDWCTCCFLRVFAQRSLELQSVLYEEDPEFAMEMVIADCTVWDIKVNPLECAYDNAMLDFIAHSCAQRRLNKIWYKRIGSTLGDFWWVSICIISFIFVCIKSQFHTFLCYLIVTSRINPFHSIESDIANSIALYYEQNSVRF